MSFAAQHLFHFYAAVGNACGTKTGLLPSLYDNISCPDGITPVITSLQDIGTIIANILRILIAISGSLAVIMILVASIFYITATGDSGRVKRARDIILHTVTGLVLIIISYALVTFIAGEF